MYKEERAEENHFVNIIFLYLKLIPSSELGIPTFVEHNPFGGVKNIIELDANDMTLLQKCSNEWYIQFCTHEWT